MQIKWIGQAGLLIDTDKFKIMVDPYLSDSVAKINPKNRRRMKINENLFEEKPEIILITHNHMDHLDPETLPKFLDNDRMITVLAPHGSWEKVREYGGNHNYVMFNRKTVWTYKNVIFTAVKAEHSDADAIGFIVDDGCKKLYITGDTLYNEEIFEDLPDDIYAVFLPVNGVGNNMNIEEPVPPDNLEALKAVKDKSPVAISAGERLYTRWDYKRMFDLMAADYIQPDISHAGGIMELKKIAAEAECRYIPFAPHNPSGPVANAATLQLAATCPNFSVLEIMYSDVEWRKDVVNEQLEYSCGYMKIPDRPGLGIEINEDECAKHPYKPHTLRHYTGALTDIRPAKTEFYF